LHRLRPPAILRPGSTGRERISVSYDYDNIFAKILRGDIPCDKVAENKHALAFNDINPQTPTHILVIPKGPYVSSDDFSANAPDEEIAAFFRLVGEVARQAGAAETGYRILANHGADAHQEVPHFHIHVFAGKDLGRMIKPAE
jgi:diadenosine tetraphosphate (Ap4A) HIT family hydrolase